MMATNDNLAVGYALGRDSNNNNGYGNGMGMWGAESWWFIIVLFALWNNGFGGWGNRGNDSANAFLPYAVGANGALTRGELCQDMNFQEVQNGVRGIQQGLCDGFYAINTSLLNGFHGVDNAVCNLGYQTQNGFNATQVAMMQGENAIQTQLADCCCTTKGAIKDAQFANMQGQNAIQNQISSCCCDLGRQIERGFCDVNYNMATNTNALMVQSANNTRDIIDSQNAGTRAILDYLCQDKISTLQAENQALRLTASQQAQNATIGAMINASEANILRRTGSDCPIPAYVVPNPNCCYGPYGLNGYNGYGYNNGGCNSGCCGCNS